LKNVKKTVLIIGIGMIVVTAVLLCRTWTWSAPFPVTLSVKVADTWADEQPWVNRGGAWSAAMPQLTKRVNSESFLGQLKSSLSRHSVVSHWTLKNTKFQPAQLSPRGPLVIHCETLTYGVRRWSILRQGSGRDRERSEGLEQDLQVALRELLKEGES
jgi:hypothetical protein